MKTEIQEMTEVEMADKAERRRPFVLVTVSGGVAMIWEHPGVDVPEREEGPPE